MRAGGIVLLSLIMACGGGDEETEPFEIVPVGEPVSATIGAAGGTITSADGHLTLEFPADALAADTVIAIQQIEIDDGWGWSLSPDGTTFAVPVTARLVFTTAEVGEPTTTLDGNVRTTSIPEMVTLHLPGTDDTTAVIAPAAPWIPGLTELEYATALEHFSTLVVAKHRDLTFTHPDRVAPGDTFTVQAFREIGEFETRRVQLWCPEKEPQLRDLNTAVRPRLSSMDRAMTRAFSPVGVTRQLEGGGLVDGFEGDLRCTQTGQGVPTTVYRNYEREGGVGWPRGCSHYAWGHGVTLPVLCVGSCTASDPVDTSTQAGGDVALDVICADTGVSASHGSWVRVVHEGSWRPSELYSWYSKVTVSDASGVVGSIIVQQHDGQFAFLYEGEVNQGNAHIYDEGHGYLATFRQSLGTFNSAAVESGVQKTVSSPRVVDTVAIPQFDITSREP